MAQKDDILAFLAKGPATHAAIAVGTGIKSGTLQAHLSGLKRAGRAVCDGVGARDPWRLPGTAPVGSAAPAGAVADDPSMIPGRAEPKCETRAIASDEAPWGAGDSELPSPDAIAVAVVTAARVLGEDPSQIAAPGWLRCRFPAVKALSVFYPDCTPQQLGRFVGFKSLTQQGINNALNFPWWNDEGDPAFAAAVDALEGLA